MKHVDNTMNIKPPKVGVSRGQPQANQVSGGTRSESPVNTGTASAGGDTVTLTNTVAEMLKLESNLAKIPDINNALVESIKTSITQGEYQVKPEQIADRLLAIDKDLS